VKPPERWVAIVGVAVLSIVAIAGFAIALYAAWLFHDMPDASDLQDYRPPTATRVYAWDGTLIGELGSIMCATSRSTSSAPPLSAHICWTSGGQFSSSNI
jgi:membrane carboxypeptidase/penicillin-binding protein